MTKSYRDGMARVTELTKSGKLQEATALIQSLLNGGGDLAAAATDKTATARPIVTTPKVAAAKMRKKPDPARSGLAETLRKIASGGMPAAATPSGKSVSVVTGARFLSLSHDTPHGSRGYRLYVPANASETPMPLIVMLHGCTQTPEDFAIGTGMNDLAEEFGCLIAYPAQPTGANAQKCWNWFRPEDQARDQGEPALIAGLTRDILRDHNADPRRVYIAGLSAGGAAAAIVAGAYPDLYQGVGVHSGLPVGAAQDVISAFGAMRSGTAGKPQRRSVPTIVLHGTDDTTVHPSNGSAVIAQALPTWPGLRSTTIAGTSSGGRGFRQNSYIAPDGRSMAEHWEISGAGHAWAGGDQAGSYTDPHGPNASREMIRFFLQHAK